MRPNLPKHPKFQAKGELLVGQLAPRAAAPRGPQQGAIQKAGPRQARRPSPKKKVNRDPYGTACHERLDALLLERREDDA